MKFKRHMSKLDVFIQLIYCRGEVSRSSNRRCSLKTSFPHNTSRRLLLSFYKKILINLKNARHAKVQKRFLYGEKKSKAWNREKRTQVTVTLTEGLAATDKG